jgi:hypothetical protein
MKTYGGIEVYLHAFLTSAMDRDEWSGSHPDRFTRGKSPWHPVDRRVRMSHRRSCSCQESMVWVVCSQSSDWFYSCWLHRMDAGLQHCRFRNGLRIVVGWFSVVPPSEFQRFALKLGKIASICTASDSSFVNEVHFYMEGARGSVVG